MGCSPKCFTILHLLMYSQASRKLAGSFSCLNWFGVSKAVAPFYLGFLLGNSVSSLRVLRLFRVGTSDPCHHRTSPIDGIASHCTPQVVRLFKLAKHHGGGRLQISLQSNTNLFSDLGCWHRVRADRCFFYRVLGIQLILEAMANSGFTLAILMPRA